MKKKGDIRKDYRKMTGEEFREYRYSYAMSQEEWAKAIDISTASVKRIETNKMECSAKTAGKVWEFIGTGGAAHRVQFEHLGLEDRMLYDIFLEHMEKIAEKEAAGYAAKCIYPLRKTLSKASACSSLDAQKNYFDFLEIFLLAMHIVASEYVDLANKGEAFPDMRDDLVKLVRKRLRKMSQTEGRLGSEKQDEYGQRSLFQ